MTDDHKIQDREYPVDNQEWIASIEGFFDERKSFKLSDSQCVSSGDGDAGIASLMAELEEIGTDDATTYDSTPASPDCPACQTDRTSADVVRGNEVDGLLADLDLAISDKDLLRGAPGAAECDETTTARVAAPSPDILTDDEADAVTALDRAPINDELLDLVRQSHQKHTKREYDTIDLAIYKRRGELIEARREANRTQWREEKRAERISPPALRAKRIKALTKATANPKGSKFLEQLRTREGKLARFREAMDRAGPNASLSKIAAEAGCTKDAARNRHRIVARLEQKSGPWHRWANLNT